MLRRIFIAVLFILAIWPLFCLSVTLFLPLIIAALVGLVVVIVGAIWKRFHHLIWAKYLCVVGLFLIVPTFGVMPLLIASRLHRELPGGNTLGIYTGITYTAIYEVFISTSEFDGVDHPFPPVTNPQLYALGCVTLAISLLPTWWLLKPRQVNKERKSC